MPRPRKCQKSSSRKGVKKKKKKRNSNKMNCKCSATYGDVEHVCGVKTVDRGPTQPGQNKRKLFCTFVGLSVQEQLEKWSTNGKIKEPTKTTKVIVSLKVGTNLVSMYRYLPSTQTAKYPFLQSTSNNSTVYYKKWRSSVCCF